MSLIDAGELFVRDTIALELNEKLQLLAQSVLSSDLDYDFSGDLRFFTFCKDQASLFSEEVTLDEFVYIMENIQVASAVEDLVRQGKVVKVDGVYKMVEET